MTEDTRTDQVLRSLALSFLGAGLTGIFVYMSVDPNLASLIMSIAGGCVVAMTIVLVFDLWPRG